MFRYTSICFPRRLDLVRQALRREKTPGGIRKAVVRLRPARPLKHRHRHHIDNVFATRPARLFETTFVSFVDAY